MLNDSFIIIIIVFIHDAFYGFSGQKLLEALIDVACLSQKAVDDINTP